eukprot:CAMPEP_0179345680 /NCGR_PEP_ID=MMETSP0797-20121207/72171_1 /TAXON_ID=47934 /ORGANISM="Dinophysis acuminata, Strain DAEP01" /LENGTH=181 /DNA_ID=CAMNT_0021060181 /DNA_START=203 /DNA_END=749 /DNA_ORIENTATION=-
MPHRWLVIPRSSALDGRTLQELAWGAHIQVGLAGLSAWNSARHLQGAVDVDPGVPAVVFEVLRGLGEERGLPLRTEPVGAGDVVRAEGPFCHGEAVPLGALGVVCTLDYFDVFVLLEQRLQQGVGALVGLGGLVDNALARFLVVPRSDLAVLVVIVVQVVGAKGVPDEVRAAAGERRVSRV